MDYYQKYQKYRFKYLNLLNQSGGVGNDDDSITKLINNFNTFFNKIIEMKKEKLNQLKININVELIILENFKVQTDNELEKLEEETNNNLKKLKEQLDNLKVQTDKELEELDKLKELDNNGRDLEKQIFYLNNEFKYRKNDIKYKQKLSELEQKKTKWTTKLKELKDLEVQTKNLEVETKKLKAIKAIKAIKVHQTIKAIEALETFTELTDKELEDLEKLKKLTVKELGVFEDNLKQFEGDKIVKFDRQLKLFTRDKNPRATYDEQLKRFTYNYNQQITYEQLQEGTDVNLLKLHENIVIYELDAVLKYLGIVDLIDTDIFKIILEHLDPDTRRNDTNKSMYFLIYNKAISHISRISYIKDTKNSKNFQIINYSSEDYLLNNFKKITREHDKILVRENEYKYYYSELDKIDKSNEIFVEFINNLTNSNKITILPFFSSSYVHQQNINKLNFEQKHRIYQIAISHNTQKDNVLNNFYYIVNNHDFNWVLGNGGIKYGEKYLEFCELLFNNINYDNINYDSYNNVCQYAVTRNGLALKYIPDMTLTEEEYLKICEIAVNQNGLALEFVDKNKMNDTEYLKICNEAIEKNPDAQKYKK